MLLSNSLVHFFFSQTMFLWVRWQCYPLWPHWSPCKMAASSGMNIGALQHTPQGQNLFSLIPLSVSFSRVFLWWFEGRVYCNEAPGRPVWLWHHSPKPPHTQKFGSLAAVIMNQDKEPIWTSTPNLLLQNLQKKNSSINTRSFAHFLVLHCNGKYIGSHGASSPIKI